MHTCSCGGVTGEAGGRCARCAALLALDLEAGASEKQIRDAYRVLVKVWHPDRFEGDAKLKQAAEDKLKALNSAYIFLTAKAAPGEPGTRERPQTSEQPRPRVRKQPAAAARPAARRPRRFRFPTGAFLKFALLAGCVLVAGVFLMAMDSFLASDPTTGRIYTEFRGGVEANFRQTVGGLWSQAGERWHALSGQKSVAAPIAAEAAEADPMEAAAQNAPPPPSTTQPSGTQSLHRREPGDAHAAPARLQPYITAGLTQDEVTAVLGAPTSSTENKLTYGSSELNFTAGKLTGWKIDPASMPIRVKLWPDAPVDPNLTSFTVGSTKNEVLVVEGTPTLFSEDTFGYGGALVYFKNNRVVGWKNDPASPPLHVRP
jgi:curved DNA-binding protein CbpA